MRGGHRQGGEGKVTGRERCRGARGRKGRDGAGGREQEGKSSRRERAGGRWKYAGVRMWVREERTAAVVYRLP